MHPKKDGQLELEIEENSTKLVTYALEQLSTRGRHTPCALSTRCAGCMAPRKFSLTVQGYVGIRLAKGKPDDAENKFRTTELNEVLLPGIQIQEVDISLIDFSPSEQSRMVFDQTSLRGLAESLRAVGLITPPVLSRNGDRYLAVTGGRRIKAAAMAGFKQIPAIIRDTQNNALVSIIENIQREQLHPLEESLALNKLIDQGYKQNDLARYIGKCKSYVAHSKKIALFALQYGPDKLIKMAKNVPREQFSRISAIPNFEKACELMKKVVEQSLTVQQLKTEIKGKSLVTDIIEERLNALQKNLNLEFLTHYPIKEIQNHYNDLCQTLDALKRASTIIDGMITGMQTHNHHDQVQKLNAQVSWQKQLTSTHSNTEDVRSI